MYLVITLLNLLPHLPEGKMFKVMVSTHSIMEGVATFQVQGADIIHDIIADHTLVTLVSLQQRI